MDGFTGRARLEWWANRSTCLEEYGIGITVAVDAAGTWRATGRHADVLDTDRRDGWNFLMEMDPRFSLVFPGGEDSGMSVRVFEAQDGTLTFVEASNEDDAADITFDRP
ncbi:hypothetical protein ABZX85_14370 [Streptomyces sp. NPDC004539]|uniref:hypothetical protein n=1 Tax=Streptomyces sp. NPDC004539 TaxID=3154280 RepID=UPI0033BC59C8